MVVPRQSAPGMVRMEAVRVHHGSRGWHGCRDEEKGECNEPCDDLGEERVGHEEEALGCPHELVGAAWDHREVEHRCSGGEEEARATLRPPLEDGDK
jgi:hypothetical protein